MPLTKGSLGEKSQVGLAIVNDQVKGIREGNQQSLLIHTWKDTSLNGDLSFFTQRY